MNDTGTDDTSGSMIITDKGEIKGNPVVTGQQIGLLGGPLYTTYKVLGAINYSTTTMSDPIYWLETNDADFNEINSIHFLDKNNTLQTLTWNKNSQGFSCGLIEVDNALITLLDTFFSMIKQTQHTESLRAMVHECYQRGSFLGQASLTLAQKLFQWSPLKYFDPCREQFLNEIRPILEKEAESTETPRAISGPGNQCNFFCIDNKQRKAVFKKHDGFYLRDGRKIELDHFLLTPNVKTRNVCQDYFFNTHTYIAGPGEIKYIAELDPVYNRHQVIKPHIKKRMSLYLIEPKTNRLLKQCGLSIEKVTSLPKDLLLKEIIQRETGTDFTTLKNSALEKTDQYLDDLRNYGIETKTLHTYLTNEIKSLIGKKRAEEKAKITHLTPKIEELSDRLLPYGKQQERVFNIFYYMNLYGGLDFIPWLYNQYDFNKQTMEINYG